MVSIFLKKRILKSVETWKTTRNVSIAGFLFASARECEKGISRNICVDLL
jgi:hypothetical protein